MIEQRGFTIEFGNGRARWSCKSCKAKGTPVELKIGQTSATLRRLRELAAVHITHIHPEVALATLAAG